MGGNFYSKDRQGVDEGETKKRTDALMGSSEVQTRLTALPPHVRSTASKVVRAIIGKLKTASDEDAKNLIEWILRYYESNVLTINLPLSQLNGSNSARQFSGSIFEGVQVTTRITLGFRFPR